MSTEKEHSGPCDSFGICDSCALEVTEEALAATQAKLNRTEAALVQCRLQRDWARGLPPPQIDAQLEAAKIDDAALKETLNGK